MFLTPVFYPVSLVPEQWQLLYCANPMASAVSLFRWGFFGEQAVPLLHLASGVVVACFALIGGFIYFSWWKGPLQIGYNSFGRDADKINGLHPLRGQQRRMEKTQP